MIIVSGLKPNSKGLLLDRPPHSRHGFLAIGNSPRLELVEYDLNHPIHQGWLVFLEKRGLFGTGQTYHPAGESVTEMGYGEMMEFVGLAERGTPELCSDDPNNVLLNCHFEI